MGVLLGMVNPQSLVVYKERGGHERQRAWQGYSGQKLHLRGQRGRRASGRP